MKKLTYLTLLFSLIVVSGCKKEQILVDKSSLGNNGLSIIDNTKINVKSSALALALDLDPFRELTSMEVQNLDESQAVGLLQPTVEAGTILYNELIDQVVGTQGWSTLTYDEKVSILNFTPQQKATLAILYDAATKSAQDGGNPRWVNCAGAALGLQQAYSLFSSAFTVGMTATTAIQALTFVGKRYLGYVGLAVAVYAFTECISSEDVSIPGDDDVPPFGDESLPIVILFPKEYNGEYYFTLHPTYINNPETGPKYSTHIYYFNNKYYFNSGKTCLLPNGYYFSNYDNNYYYVIDGKIQSKDSKPNTVPPGGIYPIEEEYPNPFDCNN